MAENDFTATEKAAYDALVFEAATPKQAEKILSKKGIKAFATNLPIVKEHLADKALYLYNKENALGTMLDSFQRVNAEFEDAVYRIRKLLAEFEEQGDKFNQYLMIRELVNLISLALKAQGKLGDKLMNINAKNVNVITPADMTEMYRKAQEHWFEDMNAEYLNGEMIIHNPSPELIDDFNKWQAKKLRQAYKVKANAE
jgi:hypothetical protein